jgi:hypothetical protein
MFRRPLRLMLALASISSMLLSSGARAQTATQNDLRPDIRSLGLHAFDTHTSEGVGAADASTLQTDPIAAPRQFTDLLIRWHADVPEGAMLGLQVRVSDDNATWSRWGVVTESDDPPGPDEPADTHWSDPIFAGTARFYQLKMTLLPNRRGDEPSFRGVQIHTVDTRIPDEGPPELTGGGNDVSATGAVGQPGYVSRTSWGSPDGEGSRVAIARRPVTHLIIHHTADSTSLTDSDKGSYANRVRAYWTFHAISRGWGDIGYNWLIDPNGVIYAGRAGSTYDTSAGGAVGFHDTANYGSMGVSVIGTYTGGTPSAAAQNSLVNLLAWKASQRGINALGKAYYLGCAGSKYCYPFNSGSVVPTIAGHRQVTPGHTTCPGDAFMGIMQTIRQRVYQIVNGGSQSPTDNGDTTIDEQETGFSKTGTFKSRACGDGGHTFWTYATNNANESTNNGTWVANLPRDGKYRVSVSIPQSCGISPGREYATTNARYEVGHANGTASNIRVDQTTSTTWVDIGTYDFKAGRNGSVRLSDMTDDTFANNPDTDKVVFFDAVRWDYVGPSSTSVPVVAARLIAAEPLSKVVPTGGVLAVRYTIRNVGTTTLNTQTPPATIFGSSTPGWVYNQWDCFMGNGQGGFDKQQGMLRATLGYADGSAKAQSSCVDPNLDNPWRWGVQTPLQPGETRSVIGYVRFHTRGIYTFEANLVNEWVEYYGTDGNESPVTIGPITVRDLPRRVFLPGAAR